MDRHNRWLTLSANLGVLVRLDLVLVQLDPNRKLMRAKTRDQIATAW